MTRRELMASAIAPAVLPAKAALVPGPIEAGPIVRIATAPVRRTATLRVRECTQTSEYVLVEIGSFFQPRLPNLYSSAVFAKDFVHLAVDHVDKCLLAGYVGRVLYYENGNRFGAELVEKLAVRQRLCQYPPYVVENVP